MVCDGNKYKGEKKGGGEEELGLGKTVAVLNGVIDLILTSFNNLKFSPWESFIFFV